MSTTLLITTNGRSGQLRHSLERLCALTLPEEILVIDDGGNDGCEQTCQTFSDRLPIRYVYNNNPGVSICSLARNIGVRLARHDWIITAEPELIFVTDIVAQFREKWKRYPNDVISAGTVYHAPEGYVPGGDMPEEIAGDYQPPHGNFPTIGWVAPYTALWKKSWLQELRGWDEGFPGPWGWDDVDLLTRLRIAGHGQHIALDVIAIHQWHGGSPGDNNFVNETYWRGKRYMSRPETECEPADLIANPNGWGVLR